MESTCLASLNTSCSRGQPAGRLLEIYNLAYVSVGLSDVCSHTLNLCSVRSAMNCITDLSVQVTLHDYTSSDSTAVCRLVEILPSILKYKKVYVRKYQKRPHLFF